MTIVLLRTDTPRAVAAALLCAAIGVAYAWNLGAASRWRERECRAANAEVRRELDEAAGLLAEADGKVKQAKRVAWIWHSTSSWYQACCLRGRP